MTTATLRAPAPARWAGFVNAVFPLPVHVAYGVLWALAYEAAAALALGSDWRPTSGSAVRAVSVIALLFYIRLVDERMDVEYDRVHNPDRPLVTGLVSIPEARRAGRLVVLLVVVVNLFVSPWSCLALVFLVAYAELVSRPELGWVRDRPLLHLAVAYPAQLAIGVYLYLSAASGVRPLLAVLVFALAFLHYEFARKTERSPGPRSYSGTALGPTGSAIAALATALGAGAVLVPVSSARLPCVALVFPLLAAVSFLGRGADHWSKTSATLFLIVFDVLVIVSGVSA